MADKFEIRARCANCGSENILTSGDNKGTPLLFDDKETALLHVSRLGKRTARVVGTLDRAMGRDVTGDTVHECAECHALCRIRNLALTVFRRP
ncbi:MAG: hypothetical protein KAU10_00505 [Dehalococcoidia bacterium]|nr:hypothetical protein [Dehalococcoidia bacterium]